MRSDGSSSVHDLLDGRLLRVPDYQRGYAWDIEHLEDFWEDLEVMPEGADHYTGTVVLRAHGTESRLKDDGGVHHDVVDIVDGQQRLTTIVLLLNELRRALDVAGAGAKARTIADRYVWIRHGGGRRPVLELGGDVADFWQEVVLPDAAQVPAVSVRSEQRLIEARRYFEQQVGHLAADGTGLSQLEELREKITDRLRFTVYEVGDEAQVGVIFETLNDRGKPLTELEKAKNYLLFLSSGLEDAARDHLARLINNSWSKIYRRLMQAQITEPSEEDRFLRAHWLMAEDHVRQNWNGTDSLKERFHRRDYWGSGDDPERLVTDVGGYVRELADASKAFCDIRRPTADAAFEEYNEHREEIRLWSHRLQRIGALASFTPLLMAIRLRYRGDGAMYRDAVELCEKFSFRVYRIEGSRVNAGQGRLFALARKIHQGDAAPEEIIDSLRHAIARWCPRPSMERQLAAEGDTRNWYGWSGLKYFLYEYEDHLVRGKHAAPRMDWGEVERRPREETIEHILPQAPREGEWTAFDDEERRALTHDLGNLVLTFFNASLSNKNFLAKRESPEPADRSGPPVYRQSPLMQEQRIAHHADWTPETVRNRHDDLAAWALERWHVEGDAPLAPELVGDDDIEDSDELDETTVST